MSNVEALMKKIENNTEVVGIIGLGYVGLPLAVSFAKKNVQVLGFEKSVKKADAVNVGSNYIGDIKDGDLIRVVKETKKLSATTDFSRIKECDAVIICVPTPLDHFKKPDMKFIEQSCVDIGKNMKVGTFISLESTTYPTTTEDFMKPIIEKESGLKEGRDFWLCFSPERVDPGNKDYKTDNTPKVVGALGEDAQKIAVALYSKAIQHLYPVSSPRVAEMVKILENTYRLINISLINELALLAGKMDINIWEVIDAAKSKPYGFQAFYPGPGIGGHCIPLDPFYLEHIAKGFNFDLTMINTAGNINNQMPHKMMNKIMYALNRKQKAMNSATILFLGVAYKPDIDDPRESPALLVMEECAKKRANVLYHDPYISECIDDHGKKWIGTDLTDALLSKADCVVFTTNHSCFDIEHIVEKSTLVVDLRNAVKTVHIEDGKVFKL
ncbi:nucleotide sugar dehydrogenase [Treponema sp. OMZ 305]|uniref:nucleotide sugar dehydrogenase n=1 Tax=Treponema sp. OMZ 305 TaxID=1659192 RepID=UPI0020A36C1D|nr:nucleotide sugar dehydrogenase [Treponema sp. OMZ 305]UTC58655.1 nucleotide sugar dehydrogenase [Treponema sp. OMZ 305]